MVTKNLFDKQVKEIAVKTVLHFDDNGHYCAIDYAELYDTIVSSGHIEYKGKIFLPSQYLVNLPEKEVIGQMQLITQQIQLVLEGKKGIFIRGTELSVPNKSFFEWVVDLSALGLLGVITSLFIIFD
ncbi:hypothetical protein [Shewanella surugensis]|uniref:Uncharacterized protein n=1 Tax=Shewanella surugensis TaxID=212020 RepID=A0ABT0LJZ1_9GAMM|nr:hypothetical protein [Shewanella surugensis]MCL1127770.1 hypothetical protein [Shewanella surugensis]